MLNWPLGERAVLRIIVAKLRRSFAFANGLKYIMAFRPTTIRLEYPSPGQVWSGLLGGADLTFAWKRELVPDANDSGDDNDESPQLLLITSKEEGPPSVESRITLE